MADARLMVDRIAAPERAELAEQIGGLIGHLGRSDHVDRIGTRLLPDCCHLVADLVNRLVPGQTLPLAADELERISQAAFRPHDLTDGRALGTMRAAVDRAGPFRLL